MTPGAKTSLLIALIIAAFFVGLFSAPDESKEVKRQYQKERKLLMDAITKKQVRITQLSTDSAAIRKKMYEDSLKFSVAYNAEKQAKLYYKKLYESIDLSRYSVPQLDSLRSVLRAGRPLPPGR